MLAPGFGRLRWLAVRSAGDPAAIVRAIRAALLAMSLVVVFAVTALFLSLLEIYGVLAHLVARRTREIGIRMALGSTVRSIVVLVLGEGVIIGAGLLMGLVGAVAVARALAGLLYGVRPTDLRVLGAVTVLTGAVALVACAGPARQCGRPTARSRTVCTSCSPGSARPWPARIASSCSSCW